MSTHSGAEDAAAKNVNLQKAVPRIVLNFVLFFTVVAVGICLLYYAIVYAWSLAVYMCGLFWWMVGWIWGFFWDHLVMDYPPPWIEKEKRSVEEQSESEDSILNWWITYLVLQGWFVWTLQEVWVDFAPSTMGWLAGPNKKVHWLSRIFIGKVQDRRQKGSKRGS